MPDLDLIKEAENGCGRLAEPVRPGPAASLEKVEELGPADSRLAQYCAKCARWKFVSMYRHYCLPAGIITVPQEMMRPLGSDHLEAGPLQRRNDCAAGHGRQCPHACAAATGTSWSIGEARS